MIIRALCLLFFISANLFGQTSSLDNFFQKLNFVPLSFSDKAMEFSLRHKKATGEESSFAGKCLISSNTDAATVGKDVEFYDTSISPEEKEKAIGYLRGILSISNVAYRLLSYPIIMEFFSCEELPDDMWKFSCKSAEFMKYMQAAEGDVMSFIVSLDKEGRIKQIKTTNQGKSSESSLYEVKSIYEVVNDKEAMYIQMQGKVHSNKTGNDLSFDVKQL